MKKQLLPILIAICCSLPVFGQKAAKSVYAELGGPGLASVNFDMRLGKREDGLGFRAGIGGFTLDFNGFDNDGRRSLITVPLGLTYLLGKDKRNYFELGAGVTPVFTSTKYSSDLKDEFRSTFGHLYFGYRLQPANGGFLFRAGIVPVFGNGYFIPYYAGFSFGYKF